MFDVLPNPNVNKNNIQQRMLNVRLKKEEYYILKVGLILELGKLILIFEY